MAPASSCLPCFPSKSSTLSYTMLTSPSLTLLSYSSQVLTLQTVPWECSRVTSSRGPSCQIKTCLEASSKLYWSTRTWRLLSSWDPQGQIYSTSSTNLPAIMPRLISHPRHSTRKKWSISMSTNTWNMKDTCQETVSTAAAPPAPATSSPQRSRGSWRRTMNSLMASTSGAKRGKLLTHKVFWISWKKLVCGRT